MTEKLSRILSIPVEITAVLGHTKMSLKDILELGKGSLIELDTLADQEVEIQVNGEKIAYGQIVIVEQQFAIKITSILEEDALLRSIS
ncbi:MAG: flagellar motor switch protein FliN [Peptostreptococcaceae bacterium]